MAITVDLDRDTPAAEQRAAVKWLAALPGEAVLRGAMLREVG